MCEIFMYIYEIFMNIYVYKYILYIQIYKYMDTECIYNVLTHVCLQCVGSDGIRLLLFFKLTAFFLDSPKSRTKFLFLTNSTPCGVLGI